jgi:hypothetical protein
VARSQASRLLRDPVIEGDEGRVGQRQDETLDGGHAIGPRVSIGLHQELGHADGGQHRRGQARRDGGEGDLGELGVRGQVIEVVALTRPACLAILAS